MFQPVIYGFYKSLLAVPRARFVAVLAACLVIGGVPLRSAYGQGQERSATTSDEAVTITLVPSTEYLLKAAVLYNFAKFTHWSNSAFDGPAAPLRLCVLGDNPFGAALPALDRRIVNSRPLITRQVSDTAGLKGCQVLFVSRSAQAAFPVPLDGVEAQLLLIVEDSADFARRGGMINLRTVDDRIRFEINLTSIRSAGLKIDTRLLQLADRVYSSLTENNTE
jgi:hypothetical protein